MMTSFYNRFIRPLSTDPYSAAREIVMNVILVCLIMLGMICLAILMGEYLFAKYTYVIPRMYAISGITLMLMGLYYAARYKNQERAVAFVLCVIFFLGASFMANQWGLLLPAPLLSFALVTVMAGILISSRFSLFAAGLCILILAILQFFHMEGLSQPDLSWMSSTSTIADVLSYGAFYAAIAVMTWLFNHQMEFSLRRAKKAEAALLRQNDLLEEKVVARTRELEKEQLEKMQQMYRFAELGHVSTALFHDLANHLSTVSLDIETLQKRTQPEILGRIDDNIRYIDTIVQRVRSQLQGKVKDEIFDVRAEISEVMKVLAYGAEKAGVTLRLDFASNRPVRYKGDVLRLRQVMMNLLSNAIEAHKDLKDKTAIKLVTVKVTADRASLTIEVSDRGAGIPPRIRERIFDPFYTSKDKGVGIGLFIVKQVVGRDLKGDVTLAKTGPTGTTFAVNLPFKRK